MKYFINPYTGDKDKYLDIRIGFVHYLLNYNSSKDGESYIPAKFIREIFRKDGLSVIDIYNILYKKGFIRDIKKIQGKRIKYYKVWLNKTSLDVSKLPISLEHKWNTYQHLFVSGEDLPFQKVLNYTIDIDSVPYEKVDKFVNTWKETEYLLYGKKKEITTDDLIRDIRTHNGKVRDGLPTWNRDNYSGRVWHLLSRNPSFVRQWTNHGWLSELDIVQCQPVLLAYLVEKYNGPKEYSELFYDNKFDIYEYLGKGNRQLGKDAFYNIVFGYGENVLLKERLPEFSKWIYNIKRKDPSLIGIKPYEKRLRIRDSEKKKVWIERNWSYYKAINLSCQLLEVELFSGFWKKLLKEGIFFIPVHDAVYFHREDLDRVWSLFLDSFSGYFGDSPIYLRSKVKDQNII